MIGATLSQTEIRHGHIFCGIGGGAKGFNRGKARVGNIVGKFRCVGGIDVDAIACKDFERIAKARATCLDLFSREQYVEFHGQEPPAGWREAGPADIIEAFDERPHIVFLSAPCKGFSGLLAEKTSQSDKYQALNKLTLRGIDLLLRAYADDPVELIIFENVPRVATRGRSLLDDIIALFRKAGYAAQESTHDCGVIGNLAQSRKRFLLVARHREKIPPHLHEPDKHRLRGVGEVLDTLPLPLSGLGGPMHRMPALQWQTWVRLGFVRAGADWRSLNELAIENGHLRDFGIVPASGFNGSYGVKAWEDPAGTVTSNGRPAAGMNSVADPRPGNLASAGRPCYGVGGWHEPACCVTSARSPGQGRGAVADPRPPDGQEHPKYRVTSFDEPCGAVISGSTTGTGAFAVADVRVAGHERSVQMGVRAYSDPAPTIRGNMAPGAGSKSIADPRLQNGKRFNNLFRIVRWGEPAPAVAGPGGAGGGPAVADPRFNWHAGASSSKLRVTQWHTHARSITGSQQVASGAGAVADPRPAGFGAERENYQSGGHYGVVRYDEPAMTVSGHACHDNGFNSVADPRVEPGDDEHRALPGPKDRLVCVIIARDGTWHRPFTTLELAALQGLVDPEETLILEGLSDSGWRERIGNMVPPPSAEAIAGVMGETLLLAWAGVTFHLGMTPIWVRNLAVSLSVQPQELPLEH